MSSDQNRLNSAVSRGGTGAVPTPANASTTTKDDKNDFSSGRRNRPEVVGGADKEGIMDKFSRTSNTGVGKDTATKATNIGQRLGLDHPIGKSAADVKDEAKGIFSKAQHQFSAAASAPVTGHDGRRRSSLMSGKEFGKDFLSNYSYEIKSENGEPDGLERNFTRG